MPKRVESLLIYCRKDSFSPDPSRQVPPETMTSPFQVMMTEIAAKAAQLDQVDDAPEPIPKTTRLARQKRRTVAEQLEHYFIMSKVRKDTAWMVQRDQPVQNKGATRPNRPHLTGYMPSPKKLPSSVPERAPSYLPNDLRQQGQGGGRAGRGLRRLTSAEDVFIHCEAPPPPIGDWLDTQTTDAHLTAQEGTTKIESKDDAKLKAISLGLQLLQIDIDRLQALIDKE